MTPPTYNNRVGAVGWKLVLTTLLLGVVLGVVAFWLNWRSATPFVESDLEKIFIVEDDQEEGGKRKGEGSGPQTGDVLKIDVTMKGDRRPQVTFKLPATGTIGVPRFSLRKDKDKHWQLVFSPPAVRAKYQSQVDESRSGWTLHVEQSPQGDISSSPPRVVFRLPFGDVAANPPIVLSNEDFEKKKGDLPASIETFKRFLGPEQEKAKAELQQLLTQAGNDYVALRLGLLDSAKAEKNLNELAKDNKLILTLSEPKSSARKNEWNSFHFSAGSLKYLLSIPFPAGRTTSVPVQVTVNDVPAKYELNIYCTKLTSSDIERFRIKTATEFSDRGKKEDLFLPPEAENLNPMFLIPILQSCRHHSQVNNPEVDKLSEAILSRYQGDKFNTIKTRLGEIKGLQNTGYYNTYLYCEYVVALVHLRMLFEKVDAKRIPGFDVNALNDLIQEGGETIAANVRDDGLLQYLSVNSGTDRSVSQAALFTLQYVALTFAKDSKRMAKIEPKFIAIAKHFSKLTDKVPYQNDDKDVRPNLLPAHYQAVAALAQSKQISPADFKHALKRLDDHFGSTEYGTQIGESYADAYRWMYWARVFELLVNLKQTNPEWFDQDVPVCPKLENALHEMAAKTIASIGPSYKLELGTNITLRNVGAGNFAAARRCMLAIAVESIWQADELLGKAAPKNSGK